MQRTLKAAEAERNDQADRVSELTTQNSSLQAAKRKAEQLLSTLQVGEYFIIVVYNPLLWLQQEEYDEMEGESKENAEKLRKSLEQVSEQTSQRCFVVWIKNVFV